MPPPHPPQSAPAQTEPIRPNPDQLALLREWLASRGLDENDPRLAEHVDGAPFHDRQLVASKKAIRWTGAEPPLRIAIEEALQSRQSRRQPRPPGDATPDNVTTAGTPAAKTQPGGGRSSRRPTAAMAPRPAVDPEPVRDAVVVATSDGLVAVYGDPHPQVRKLLGQELGPIPAAITNRLVGNSDAWAGAGAASALRELGGLGQAARDAGRLYQVATGSQSAVAAAGGLNAGKNGALLPMIRGSNGRITHIVGLQRVGTGLRVLGNVTGLALVAFHIVGITNLHKRLVAVEQGVGRLERRFALEDAARVQLAWDRLAEFWQVYQDQGEPFPSHAMLAMLPDTDDLRLLAQRTSLQAAALAEALDPRKLPSDAKRRRGIVEAVRAEEQAIYINVLATLTAHTSEGVRLGSLVHPDGSMASPHMIAAAQRRHAEDWDRIRGRHNQFAHAVNTLSTDPGRAAWWKVFGDENRKAVRHAVAGADQVLNQCGTILDTLNDGDGSLKRIGSR